MPLLWLMMSGKMHKFATFWTKFLSYKSLWDTDHGHLKSRNIEQKSERQHLWTIGETTYTLTSYLLSKIWARNRFLTVKMQKRPYRLDKFSVGFGERIIKDLDASSISCKWKNDQVYIYKWQSKMCPRRIRCKTPLIFAKKLFFDRP